MFDFSNTASLDLFALVGQIAGALTAPLYDIAAQHVLGGLGFAVQSSGGCDPCPGSQFTSIAAAYANIGYMTHSDLLYYITSTKFGLWGPLLFVAAAIGALIGVAINTPPRTYVWFMLGPAIYGILINTTQEVKGVDWTVAGRPQDMKEVWRNAETGAFNTQLVHIRQKLDFNKEDGPSGTYPVATAFLYLDELFSATSNMLVDWSGLYFADGTGASNSNLAAAQGQAEGPWYILSSSKWGLLENLTSATARNPNIRDSLVTFLTNECGDAFKKAISDGRFIAASTSRGSVIPGTVFNTKAAVPDFNGESLPEVDYKFATETMYTTNIPTPRGLSNLLNDFEGPGSFGKFAPKFQGRTGATMLGGYKDRSIVCTEYLYTLIQAFRWESGHSYHQLLRSSPRGLNAEQFLKTLFYGWDIRKNKGAQYASAVEITAFAKMIIFIHMLRNELLFAPQITKTDARYAPSEQSRNFSEAYIRSYGSKSKFSELYQWAVLMPHLQGILLYVIIIGYPFACMLMVIPGYWKAFFTWVTFFAWLKLWDVGFAIVQVLERSVWAMIGNNSNMARISNMLITTAEQAGSVGISCPGGSTGADITGALSGLGAGGLAGVVGSTTQSSLARFELGQTCAVPSVCSVNGLETACTGAGIDQSEASAFALFDRALILGTSSDLDLSNGYYIYIMAALYFAVPMVTGQLVLGAKAGVASSVGGLFNSVASEAGRAALTGRQHADVNAIQNNAGSVQQAAYAKALSKGLAAQQLEAANTPLEADRQIGRLDGLQQARRSDAQMYGLNSRILNESQGPTRDGLNTMGEAAGGVKRQTRSGTGVGPDVNPIWSGLSAVGGFGKKFAPILGGLGSNALAVSRNRYAQIGYAAEASQIAGELDTKWDTLGYNMQKSGAGVEAQRLSGQAHFAAETAAWEARNSFAAHASSYGGLAGMNAGALAPGLKPINMDGMAREGMLGAAAYNASNASADYMRTYPQSFYNMKSSLGSSRLMGSGDTKGIYEGTLTGTSGFTKSMGVAGTEWLESNNPKPHNVGADRMDKEVPFDLNIFPEKK